jgi:CubicO group peptidase (beta-lactamase class C family)
MRPIGRLILSILLIPLSTALAGTDLPSRIRAFNAALDPANRISGVLLVTQGDSLLLHEPYGTADAGGTRSITLDDRFCIASVTKIMTQIVVVALLQEEELALDTPLADFAPEFPRGDDITVEWLFRHRAGIPHRVTTPGETKRATTAEEMTARAARAVQGGLLTEPGEDSYYSSAGYSVLAYVVERVEGMPFGAVLEQRIFDPAGMTDTFDPSYEERPFVPSLMPGRDGILPAPEEHLSYLVGAGSVVSTAADLRRFFLAYRDGTLGDGLWASLQGPGDVHWTGATNGYYTFLDYDAAADRLVIFTSNTFGGGVDQLRTALPDLIAGKKVLGRPRPAELATVEPETLARYAGRYRSRPGSYWTVEHSGGELWIMDNVALPLSRTEFYYQPLGTTYTFVEDTDTGTWSMTRTEEDGSTIVWPRVE